ncbi:MULTISPECIES: HigA family addiction module antitoxin [unclassified Endozoicomonas]|uniref:HigA family addiction module antitoxin n=1 Tax=unclassified Endozoicomonas TaxID=2644528 RepID=UPI002149865D|nr:MULTISPECIES: HigA family addiction module antitoxin [unclassified Endozoicomonas]
MATQQFDPPHPGALINRTYIEPFTSMTANRIADQLGVARSTFNRLLNEKAGVSPEMAIRPSEVLGGSAESWMTLQESCGKPGKWSIQQTWNALILIRWRSDRFFVLPSYSARNRSYNACASTLTVES